MDGRALYPKTWHPHSEFRYFDGTYIPWVDAWPSRTAAGGVRYYLIDFGISVRDKDLAVGIHGQERAPELSDNIAYNPYRLDVYILGMAYKRFFLDVSDSYTVNRF